MYHSCNVHQSLLRSSRSALEHAYFLLRVHQRYSNPIRTELFGLLRLVGCRASTHRYNFLAHMQQFPMLIVWIKDKSLLSDADPRIRDVTWLWRAQIGGEFRCLKAWIYRKNCYQSTRRWSASDHEAIRSHKTKGSCDFKSDRATDTVCDDFIF